MKKILFYNNDLKDKSIINKYDMSVNMEEVIEKMRNKQWTEEEGIKLYNDVDSAEEITAIGKWKSPAREKALTNSRKTIGLFPYNAKRIKKAVGIIDRKSYEEETYPFKGDMFDELILTD